MFTRISKVILIFMEIVLAIASIVGGKIMGDLSDDGGFGFLMALVFLVASFFWLCIFGVIVECANNVLDVKNMLKYYAKESTTVSFGVDKGAQLDLSQDTAQKEHEYRDGWFCSECGTRNVKGAFRCKSCGAGKYGN
jgi:ribosomal protein L40E